MELTFYKRFNGRPEPLTKEKLIAATTSAETARLIAAFRKGDADAKLNLPAVSWQCAGFKNGVRKNADAVPNGLFALDIDHVSQQNLAGISTPRQLFESFEPRIDELDIVCVHQTPSADGLRVVALCQPQFSTIAENQAWLAQEIGCGYDAVCRDWARLFFLSVPADFYYFDWETLFG